MTKKTASLEEVAKILADTALSVSPSHFREIAAHALKDNSPAEIAAVGQYMPKQLREMLPVKYLH